MKKIFIFIIFCYSWSLFAQEIEVVIKEPTPYKLDQIINIEVYLTNTTDSLITCFDSRGASWDSFKEVWDLNVASQYVEILPLNNAHDHYFSDSTFITFQPSETRLIRTHFISLEETGLYSLTYTQEQSPDFVQKKYADNSVSDSLVKEVTVFKASHNIKFEVLNNYDTTMGKLVDMPWEEWKDYRNSKLYSRKKHFDNIYDALKNPKDVYSLTLYCNGLTIEDIKRLARLKNLRKLILRNYEFSFFPKEIAELNLYELTLMPKNEAVITFPEGLSKNNTIRKLCAKFYGGFPEQLLTLKHLSYLDISNCPIKTLPMLDSLQNLEVLIANNCKISTLRNANLHKLSKIKDLNFSGNKGINDLTPLLKCTSLEFLVINRTSIDTISHDIENLKKLKKLSISNGLTMVTDSIGNLEDMRYLSLGGNRKLSHLPQSITKMKNLLHLDISNTKIEVLPEGIAELPLEKVLIYNTSCEITKEYKALRKRLGSKFKE